MDILKTLGLRGPKPPELEVRIGCFREVLQANNAALGYLAGIQAALESELPLAASEVRRLTTGVMVQTYRMISNLNRMTGDRHKSVGERFEELKGRIARAVEVTPALNPVGMALPLGETGPALCEVVGQKSAYLGEARRILGGHVPEGFAVTSAAYHAFMAEGGLGERLATLLAPLDAGDVAACFAAAAEASQLVERAPVPAEVRSAIEEQLARLAGGDGLRLAVRSSALQEGGLEMSFAGQYRSLLNISREGVIDALRSVLASKYSPQAITYRLGRGYRDEEVAMCCCVVAMVDARAAGVLYTGFPTEAGPRTVVQSVHGLGLSAVDGSVEPDSFVIERSRGGRVLEHKRGQQTHQLRVSRDEGTERAAVGSEEPSAITEEEALSLSGLAWRLEDALGMPLDVEWAIDRQGELSILQVRPLSDISERAAAPRKKRVVGAAILVERGARASGGAAAGTIFQVESDLDLLCCPVGAVVVTREANPRLAVLLPKAAAIVADLGELTGHLATVARELKVPALFATRNASELLRDGIEVTVDADAGVVYAGRVAEALAVSTTPVRSAQRDPNRERLAEVSHLIIPLTLRDRLASGFSPKRCTTIHDLIRFCHQNTVEAMFDIGDSALRKGERLRRLVSQVPIDCRVLDLGGGIAEGAPDGPDLEIEHLACRPMRVLWQGMTDPRLRWRQQRPVSVRGFMSALVNYNFDDDARMRKMGEPSFAFITAEYLNLNSRIGYHFSTIDARICDTVESNYASFRFVGGSTGIDQRSRRALLIHRLLSAHGFETDCKADLVNCRIRHRPVAEMEEALNLVGLLMGYVNHLDMALVSDAAVALYEQQFLLGNYGFKGDEPPRQAESGEGEAP